MQKGQLLMSQIERDRLVTLGKVKKRLITQAEAARELNISVRHVKRLLKALKKHGDNAVIHGLRGRPLPPTQIGRALQELNIVRIAAHSPQAKGRVARGFSTAQDRLVKGRRVAGASSLEQA
ncbi:MAG: helix-turn-helix domain-containing protein, partial [Acidobacteriaceae bacterium]|nr:helix-turn-helix domain-containing protein [Acidobacteriaceae bacterium]